MNQYDLSINLATAAAAGADYTSPSYALNGLQDYSIHVIFSSATLNGTLTIEAANDTIFGFVTIANSSQAIASGVSFLYNPTPPANYKYVRLKWVYTSGSGTLSAIIVVKGQS